MKKTSLLLILPLFIMGCSQVINPASKSESEDLPSSGEDTSQDDSSTKYIDPIDLDGLYIKRFDLVNNESPFYSSFYSEEGNVLGDYITNTMDYYSHLDIKMMNDLTISSSYYMEGLKITQSGNCIVGSLDAYNNALFAHLSQAMVTGTLDDMSFCPIISQNQTYLLDHNNTYNISRMFDDMPSGYSELQINQFEPDEEDIANWGHLIRKNFSIQDNITACFEIEPTNCFLLQSGTLKSGNEVLNMCVGEQSSSSEVVDGVSYSFIDETITQAYIIAEPWNGSYRIRESKTYQITYSNYETVDGKNIYKGNFSINHCNYYSHIALKYDELTDYDTGTYLEELPDRFFFNMPFLCFESNTPTYDNDGNITNMSKAFRDNDRLEPYFLEAEYDDGDCYIGKMFQINSTNLYTFESEFYFYSKHVDENGVYTFKREEKIPGFVNYENILSSEISVVTYNDTPYIKFAKSGSYQIVARMVEEQDNLGLELFRCNYVG